MTQEEYISILFDKLTFTSAQKRDFINLRYQVKYADELTKQQKSELIADLKERVEGIQTASDDEVVYDWDELTARERAKKGY